MKKPGHRVEPSPPARAADEISRRAYLQLGAGVLLCAAGKNAEATSPLSDPLPIEKRVQAARLIFTGRLSRVLYLSKRTSEKLYEPGSPIDPEEFRLYERHQLSEPGRNFVEVENARPLFLRKDVSVQEEDSLARGVVYYPEFVDDNPYMGDVVRRLLGKNAIFLWREQDRRVGIVQVEAPFPVYRLPGFSTWQDASPLPIQELDVVSNIARSANFREPVARMQR